MVIGNSNNREGALWLFLEFPRDPYGFLKEFPFFFLPLTVEHHERQYLDDLEFDEAGVIIWQFLIVFCLRLS